MIRCMDIIVVYAPYNYVGGIRLVIFNILCVELDVSHFSKLCNSKNRRLKSFYSTKSISSKPCVMVV